MTDGKKMAIILTGLAVAGMCGVIYSYEPKQKAWECRPQPGYCDIDTDWRPTTRPGYP